MDARVQKMVDLWLWYCGEANLGYDQLNRWDFPKYGDTKYAGECDCSSLMYHCAVEAGFALPTSGTRYTGTMKRDFINAGFKWSDFTSIYDVPVGAILYKNGHTAGWTGHYICEAYIDEHGGDRGGAAGDQANETRLSPPRGGWEGYFYWPKDPKHDIITCDDSIIEEGSNGVAHQMEQESYSYTYEKYESGRLVCCISDYFNGGKGAAYSGSYYLDKTIDFPEMFDGPAFIEPPYIKGISVRAVSGFVNVQFSGLYKNKATFFAHNLGQEIPKFYVDLIVEGKWK